MAKNPTTPAAFDPAALLALFQSLSPILLALLQAWLAKKTGGTPPAAADLGCTEQQFDAIHALLDAL